MKQIRINERGLLGAIALGFTAWAVHFIYRTSFIALDGRRYFVLFDDAMISMRYAWNLSHGLGLVWNAGERVEGYTNLLMTLVMALATGLFDKVTAVLAVQLFGILTLLAIGGLAASIAGQLAGSELRWRALIRVLVFICALGYYPLNYWTLMGMETGLMAVFVLGGVACALQWADSQYPQWLTGMALCFGLAFLTRSDSGLYAALTFAFVAFESFRAKTLRASLAPLMGAAGVYAAFIGGQTLFRWLYYGELLPNTYVLKLTGISLADRIANGRSFIAPFLQESLLPFALATADLIFNFQRRKLLLASFMASAIAYQVYVGGDPWNYWRQMAPVMPLVFVLAVLAALNLSRSFTDTKFYRHYAARPIFPSHLAMETLAAAIALASLWAVDARFSSEISPRGLAYNVLKNWRNVNTALALNAVTTNEATVGVIFAGTIPYYTDRRAIDFLGKSDTTIAHLPANTSGSYGIYGMYSVPGHNKYDLDYSIKTLRPTYVQTLEWAEQNVSDWAKAYYVSVEYSGIPLILLRESPAVRWELVQVTD